MNIMTWIVLFSFGILGIFIACMIPNNEDSQNIHKATKISYSQFKSLYDFNPKRWYLYLHYVGYESYDDTYVDPEEYVMGYTRNVHMDELFFKFGIIDTISYDIYYLKSKYVKIIDKYISRKSKTDKEQIEKLVEAVNRDINVYNINNPEETKEFISINDIR